MKKITLLLSFFISPFLAQSQNLILNPSGEEILVNGPIPHWNVTIGDAWLLSPYNSSIPLLVTETSGGRLFYPEHGSVLNDGQMVSELQQSINISSDSTLIDQGSMNYFLDAYVISFNQSPADQSNLIVEFLDVNNVVLNTFTFGPYFSVTEWTHIVETILAPVNSRNVNIKLHSVLINGSSNDGLYDDLYFGRTSLLGVSENEVATSNISIYPNPSTEIINITTTSVLENTLLSIIDLNGRVVYSVHDFDTKNPISVSNLASGVYILKLLGENFNHSTKFIKQ